MFFTDTVHLSFYVEYILNHFILSTQTLYDAGEKKWGTDESKFIDVLCQRSIPQLRQSTSTLTHNEFSLNENEVIVYTFRSIIGNGNQGFFFCCFICVALVEYKNISGKTLQQSIEGEMSGELEELLVAIGALMR